jgi:hypothetical protein
MHRMGHASRRAALIYQHATSERDREIAEGMDKRITNGMNSGKPVKDADDKRAKRSKPTEGSDKPGKRRREASPDTEWHTRSSGRVKHEGPGRRNRR